MSSSFQPSIREIYSLTCEKLLDMREKISQEVLEEAEKVRDVSISRKDLFEKAEKLVSAGCEKFEKEASMEFQVPPWSDIKTMFLNTSKKKYFFSSLELLGKVEMILRGETPKECNSNIDWEW
jgi:hypothetical protein